MGAGGALGYYASFYSTQTQTIPSGGSTGTAVTMNNQFSANGITNSNGRVTFQFGGTFLIQGLLQLQASMNNIVFDYWFQQNGATIPNSNYQYLFPSVPSSPTTEMVGVNATIIQANPGDTLQFLTYATGGAVTLLATPSSVSYTHLTLTTIYSV